MADLTAFVPQLAVELGRRAGNTWTAIDGAMLSADISGFTALSERLATKGKQGAEEITDLINTCFGALIDAAYEFGGEVLKFGGDALLILFRGAEAGDRAVDAGLGMQAALANSGAARRAQLSMTVGVGEGPFDAFLVGSNHRELLISGPKASEVIRLEGAAGQGETLVADALALALGADHAGRFEPSTSVDAAMVALQSSGREPSGPAERAVDADLSPYVPATVVEQLEAFQSLGGEHRYVAVGFVAVGGVQDALRDRGPGVVAQELGDLTDLIDRSCEQYGVTLLHTDVAGDGVKFILCAGAPLSAGDTADAMLRAALEIARHRGQLSVKQGVQVGRVFAGFLGTAFRRTYTLMGDPVNTAARMLALAGHGDVVAVADAVKGTRSVFLADPLAPAKVKGKKDPIKAFSVVAATDESKASRFVTVIRGRDDELARLDTAAAAGGTVVVTAPAGVGKTTLLDAFRAQMFQRGVQLFSGAGTHYGSASPYSLFRPFLRQVIGMDLYADPLTAGELLTKAVQQNCLELEPWLPLLADAIGAEVDPTDAASNVDIEFRRTRTEGAIIDLLEALTPPDSVLLFEDAHWIDEPSASLLTHLCGEAARGGWTVLVSRRPTQAWDPPAGASALVLDLEPLGDDAIRQIAVDAGTEALSDAVLLAVVERSGGNPLFAVELARGASSAGAADLPQSIEGVIGSRLDRLTPPERHFARAASVFGVQFDPVEVSQLVERVGGQAVLHPGVLDGLLEPTSRGRWRFAHALYRDTSYEGLPYRRRRELHGAAGELIEDRDGVMLDDFASDLSLHFHEAKAHRKAWMYGRRAGELAQRQAAHTEAAVAFERAMVAAPYADIDTKARREVSAALGDAQFLAGSFERSDHWYRKSQTLGDPPAPERAQLYRKRGEVRLRQGDFTAAIRMYRRGLREVDGDPLATGTRAELLLAIAGTKHRQGRDKEAIQICERALADAAAALDPRLLALAHERLHLSYTYLRDSRSRYHGAKATAGYEQLSDHRSLARLFGNLGVEAHFASDWPAAVTIYQSAVESALRAGDLVQSHVPRNNIAEILSDQGHWGLAIEIFEDVTRAWTSSGFGIGVGVARSNLGLALGRSGDLERAAEELDRAVEKFLSLGVEAFRLETTVRKAELAVLGGDFAEAGRLGDIGRSELPPAADDPEVAALVSRLGKVAAAIQSAEGDDLGARTALEAALVVAIGAGAEFIAGLVHHDLAELGGSDAEYHRAQALVSFRTLGVAQLPGGIAVSSLQAGDPK